MARPMTGLAPFTALEAPSQLRSVAAPVLARARERFVRMPSLCHLQLGAVAFC